MLSEFNTSVLIVQKSTMHNHVDNSIVRLAAIAITAVKASVAARSSVGARYTLASFSNFSCVMKAV